MEIFSLLLIWLHIAVTVLSDDIITTIAGTGTSSYSGDNVGATSAALNNPLGVALDSSGRKYEKLFLLLRFTLCFLCCTGNVYIADTTNYRARYVKISTGIISTIAGTGTSSYSGDNGAATSATLSNPTGIAVDASGRRIHCYSFALRFLCLMALFTLYR